MVTGADAGSVTKKSMQDNEQKNIKMTINELINTAHKQARDAGFWDNERNLSECLMLIVSECGEALEAHRSRKRADLAYHDAFIQQSIERGATNEWGDYGYRKIAFANIKDTFEDELADIVIRIADYLGGIGAEASESLINSDDGLSVNYPHLIDPEGPVGEALMNLVHHICLADCATKDDEKTAAINPLLNAMWIVSGIAFVHNIDLWRHIELKLQYLSVQNRWL